MRLDNLFRRLRGAVKIGVVWGVVWGALAFATIIALRTIGVVVPPTIGPLDALGMAIRVGVMGGITGAAFSLFISLAYRGRRLSEISALRFGIGGGIVAGVFVPTFMETASLLTGGGLVPFHLIRGDIVTATLFGGIAAGASMWLAKRGEVLAPGGTDAAVERLGAGDGAAPLRVEDAREPERVPRADR